MGDDLGTLAIGAMGFVAVLIILPLMLDFVGDNQEKCELEWVDCTDDDKIGDCEEQHEEIVTGPYWNEIIETKITLRKQICKEQGD